MIFRRSESAQVRTLLRVIESQAQTIREQNDRIMHMTGSTWTLPDLPENTTVRPDPPERTWTATPEQESIYG